MQDYNSLRHKTVLDNSPARLLPMLLPWLTLWQRTQGNRSGLSRCKSKSMCNNQIRGECHITCKVQASSRIDTHLRAISHIMQEQIQILLERHQHASSVLMMYCHKSCKAVVLKVGIGHTCRFPKDRRLGIMTSNSRGSYKLFHLSVWICWLLVFL